MHIHIMPVDKFTNDFIKFINEYFESTNHFFYLYGDDEQFYVEKYDNVKHIEHLSNEVDLSLLCNTKDKLIIHSFIVPKVNKFLYYNIKTLDFNRVVLVMWGGDIYDNNLRDSVLEWMIPIERMKKAFIPKVKMFMTFACGDYDYVKKMYGADGIQFDCLYPSSVDKKMLDSIKELENDKKIVQVGNSATFTNQHREVFNMLHKYKGRIKVVCPLSYGNIEYRKEVMCYGKNMFGKDFIPITDYLPPEEYAKFLGSVDVAIFNNNRQQATANIEILAYLGKKIYMRDDTSLWSHYVIRDGCEFHNIYDICEQSYDEFLCSSQESIEKNKCYFENIWNDSYIKSKWDAILDLEMT